jgi:hypothetical protein
MSQRTMSVVGYVENVLPHMFTLNRSKLGMKLVLVNLTNAMNFRTASIVSGVYPSPFSSHNIVLTMR